VDERAELKHRLFYARSRRDRLEKEMRIAVTAYDLQERIVINTETELYALAARLGIRPNQV